MAPPTAGEDDAVLATVKAWPDEDRAERDVVATASLDGVCARCHPRRQVGTKKRLPVEQRNCKQTQRAWLTCAAPSSSLIDQAAFACEIHGVPRATTVLAKMSSFLAQAMSARLCCFPAAMRRR